MNLTDGEAILMIQNRQDRNFASRQIKLANGEIRRLRSLLAHAQAELEDAQEELKTDRAARLLAEYQLNKRH